MRPRAVLWRQGHLGTVSPSVLALAMALLTGALACRAPVGQPGAEQASVHQERVRVGPIALQTVSVGPTDGPVILVVHGGPGLDHNYMRPWFDGVRSPRARVVYVDLRGHGRSDMPPDSEGFTIGATAGDLAELLLRLSPTDPAVVIGHDFGAAISLTLAASHPERVRKLVLIAPLRDGLQIRSLGARTRATLGPAGAAAIGALSTAQGTLRDPRQLRALFAALGPMWWARPPSDALLDSLTRSVQYHGVTDGNFLAQLVLWDGRAVARNVRTPTLVVGGALDKTCLPIESRELADSLPHGQYAEIAQAGHLPFVEQPQRFVSLVRAFVTE